MDDDGETTYETAIFLCFNLKYTFIRVFWWTRQRIHNTLIVVDRYLRLMGDKTIPDSAEPRLESFYPPFVAGIDLPHQGVVDSYNLPRASIHPLQMNRPPLIHRDRVTHIYASVNYATIASDNDLPPVRCKAIVWINAGLMLYCL